MKQALIFLLITLLLSCGSNTADNKGSSSPAANTGNDYPRAAGSEVNAPAATTGTATQDVEAADQFTISGTIQNASSQQVFLDKYSLNQGQENVSSVVTGADGSFSFNGKIKEKGFHLIRLNNNVNWLIILDKGNLKITADATNIYKHSVEGSPEAATFSEFIVKAGQNQNTLNQLNQQFNVARGMGQMQQMVTVQQQYQQKFKESQNYLRSTIEKSEYPLVSLFAASLMNVEENAEYLDNYLAKAAKDLPGSPHVAELKKKVETATRLALGRVAPDIKIKSPKGETVALSSTRGKVVLLDFWASWCRPCRMENPNVVKLYDKYHPKGFDIFSVSLDQNMDKWVQAINTDNLKWKNHGSTLQGWQCPIAKDYEIHSIPNTLLLDKDGKIIAKNLRGEELANKLRELFGA